SRAEMLRQCLKVSAEIKRHDEGVHVEVALRVDGAGHRVPTGFIDRHIMLSVEGQDGKGSVDATAGPRLPAAAGRELAARPGMLFAKLLHDEEGRSPAPFWKADVDPIDTRLRPGREERSSFRFPS